jgi:hypothetical protein
VYLLSANVPAARLDGVDRHAEGDRDANEAGSKPKAAWVPGVHRIRDGPDSGKTTTQLLQMTAEGRSFEIRFWVGGPGFEPGASRSRNLRSSVHRD